MTGAGATDSDGPGEPRERETANVERAAATIELFVRECRTCQAETAPHWQFCANCGSRLATACPSCGSALPPVGAHYCPHCGLELPPELWPASGIARQ